MRWVRAGGAAIMAVLVILLAWRATRGIADEPGGGDNRTWKPLPRTVTVEVLNGGDISGAARDAALRLRRGRLDVVGWSNAPAALRDSTVGVVRILVRRGDTTGTGRIAEVLGPTEVIDRPDERRLVDLTVVIPGATREP